MWLMLQQPKPDDYVIATGESHSVREFCEVAFAHAGLDYKDFVVEDSANYRQAETALLVGNPAKAHRVLVWQPIVTFQELVRMMVEVDMKAIYETRQY